MADPFIFTQSSSPAGAVGSSPAPDLSSSLAGSSPARNGSGSGRARKPPSITPRKFRRFFSPLSYPTSNIRSGRHPLSDLTASLNAISSPADGRPSKRARINLGEPSQPKLQVLEPKSLQRIVRHTAPAQLLSRESGCQKVVVDCWEGATAHFHSHREDLYTDENQARLPASHGPWSIACCTTNPISVLGLGDGSVSVFDSFRDCLDPDASNFLAGQGLTQVKVSNGFPIVDVKLDAADRLVAACDTSTISIIDIAHEKITCRLPGEYHGAMRAQWVWTDSNRSSNIVAITGWKGYIDFWDLRSPSTKSVTGFGPAHDYRTEPKSTPSGQSSQARITGVFDSITTAAFRQCAAPGQWRKSVGETDQRMQNYSLVTPVSDICAPRQSALESYLLSCSGSMPYLRLWDIRTATSSSERIGRPVSDSCIQTQKPTKCTKISGISSLSIDETGTKIYGVAKDDLVHVWSMSHLAYGRSALTSAVSTASPFTNATGSSQSIINPFPDEQLGCTPIYRYQLPRGTVRSGLIRGAYTAPQDGRPAFFAVGSKHGKPFIFPTSESFLTDRTRLSPREVQLTTNLSGDSDNVCSVYRLGRQLDGSNCQSSAVAWTSQGHLLASMDDGLTHLWRSSIGLPFEACEEGKEYEAPVDHVTP